MTNFVEVDFLSVESKKSGDAIALRYQVGTEIFIHVVDGGFQASGDGVAKHINDHYGRPGFIDHVVVTHSDGDHAGGLRTVLETYNVGALWMLRPWIYAEALLPYFATYTSAGRLEAQLRSAYPNLVALEEIADRRGIPIREPFQGAKIGAFTVLAPSPSRFGQLILDSDKTPEAVESAEDGLLEEFARILKKITNFVRAAWGEEVFSTEATSRENEMSVVQYADLGRKILLTGDAGREALAEAVAYAPSAGLILPGLDMIQVPHHGSRRNVSTDLLDALLGPRLAEPVTAGSETISAIVSSAKEDEHHPRKSVVRAFAHRGALVVATEGNAVSWSHPLQQRAGWGPAVAIPYPEDQESN